MGAVTSIYSHFFTGLSFWVSQVSKENEAWKNGNPDSARFKSEYAWVYSVVRAVGRRKGDERKVFVLVPGVGTGKPAHITPGTREKAHAG
jgi:hypothetical protein